MNWFHELMRTLTFPLYSNHITLLFPSLLFNNVAFLLIKTWMVAYSVLMSSFKLSPS